MHISFAIPAEIWEFILDFLDRKSLLQCQHTCHVWRQRVIEYVMTGKLKNRAFVSLFESDIYLHPLRLRRKCFRSSTG